jgi:hypothetical protein
VTVRLVVNIFISKWQCIFEIDTKIKIGMISKYKLSTVGPVCDHCLYTVTDLS